MIKDFNKNFKEVEREEDDWELKTSYRHKDSPIYVEFEIIKENEEEVTKQAIDDHIAWALRTLNFKINSFGEEMDLSEFKKETENTLDDIKEFNPHIKFWTNRHNEYERENFFTKEKEIMHRIRLPKESKYSEYSLDTKLQPKNNPDGKTSYITIDKDFQYKLIAPAKDGEKLDWTKKEIKKVSGYELKLEFEKDKSINNLYKSKEKEKYEAEEKAKGKDIKTKSR